MKRILISGLLGLLSISANALEISGIKVPERIQSGERVLLLNGAGVKYMSYIYSVYALALYLPEKKHSVEEILSEGLSKRLDLTFLYSGATSTQLLEATSKLLSENLTAEEMKRLPPGWKMFEAIFDNVKKFNRGDQLAFDYVASSGLQVSLNGREIGRVSDVGFMRLFLLVWLGPQPAQENLKLKLLDIADGK
jgi:hypothetical protein